MTSSEAERLLKEGHAQYFKVPPDFSAAEECYRKATDLDPDSGEAFHALGGALQQQNKIIEACNAERIAVRLLPSDPRPLIALGWCLRLCGHYVEAIEPLETGLRLGPRYGETDAQLMLAEVYECLGRIEDAAILWRAAISKEKTYPSFDQSMTEAEHKLRKYRFIA